MITVAELAHKLNKYASKPENSGVEVMIEFDGDVALEFSHGTDEVVMSPHGSIMKFLVLRPQQKSAKRLKLKGSE